MKLIRPLALSLAVGLLLPMAALAQSLPPMDNGYGSNPYGGYQQYPPATQPQYGGGYQQAPLQGRVVTAPQGTMVSVTSSMSLSSETATIGQPVMVTLTAPITSGGSILLPAGSQIQGQVANVNKAHRGFGDFGELDIRFNAATLPNGQTIPLSAHIQTADGKGVIRGGTTKARVGKSALKTAVGAGGGALAGLIAASMSGGQKGKATALMVPVGAGAGLLAAGWDKGDEAVLNAGEPINIVLDQPLSASPFGEIGSYSQVNPGYAQPAPYSTQPNPYGTQPNPYGAGYQNYQPNPQPVQYYGQ